MHDVINSSVLSCYRRAKRTFWPSKAFFSRPVDVALLLKHSLYRVAVLLIKHRDGILHFHLSTNVIKA